MLTSQKMETPFIRLAFPVKALLDCDQILLILFFAMLTQSHSSTTETHATMENIYFSFHH